MTNTPTPRAGDDVATDAEIEKRMALAVDISVTHKNEALREVARQDLRILNRLSASEAEVKRLSEENARGEGEERERLMAQLEIVNQLKGKDRNDWWEMAQKLEGQLRRQE